MGDVKFGRRSSTATSRLQMSGAVGCEGNGFFVRLEGTHYVWVTCCKDAARLQKPSRHPCQHTQPDQGKCFNGQLVNERHRHSPSIYLGMAEECAKTVLITVNSISRKTHRKCEEACYCVEQANGLQFIGCTSQFNVERLGCSGGWKISMFLCAAEEYL